MIQKRSLAIALKRKKRKNQKAKYERGRKYIEKDR